MPEDVDLDLDAPESLENAVQRHIASAEEALKHAMSVGYADPISAFTRLADTHMKMAAWYEAHMPIPDMLPSEPEIRGQREGQKRLGD